MVTHSHPPPLQETLQHRSPRTMNNSTCGCRELPGPQAARYIFFIYTGWLLVLGLLFNGLALWVLCCRLLCWTETRVYMANLAVADFCLLCALPFFLHFLKSSTDSPLCQLSQGIYLANSCSGQKSYTVVFSLLGFYLPLAVLVFCSLQVVTTLAQTPAADAGQAEATRKASRMVLANLAVFVVCFLPFHVVLAVRTAMGLHTCAIHLALQITSRLSDANCCLDAICYYFVAKEFQEASALTARPTRAKAHKSQDSLCVTLA
ncbi:G-protein coupled receptor 35 isoform X4 [Phocoena sinus]|uniref:G-protein coupled receptor 35 isoform X4 n=1 Tax=Phocoena sinus TaxID=42100 RepID=UPI0013C44296|nr:G-protein coupled receptor 35 isoform X4 [Phocoena sinus]